MIREYQGICDNNILSSPSCEHNYLRDVVWRQWVNTLVDSIRLLLISTEPYD